MSREDSPVTMVLPSKLPSLAEEPSPSTRPPGARQAQLSQQANRLRDRLALTLSELDRRRHHVKEALHLSSKSISAAALPVEFIAGIAVGVVAAGALVAVANAIDRRRHPYRERWSALVRAWEHPHRVAR